jgi:hypothetical protein
VDDLDAFEEIDWDEVIAVCDYFGIGTLFHHKAWAAPIVNDLPVGGPLDVIVELDDEDWDWDLN